MQNRRSAQKCRLKKKEEFGSLKQANLRLTKENTVLNEKLNEVTMMLYRRIDENQAMTKRLEQCQMQHTMFLTKLLL